MKVAFRQLETKGKCACCGEEIKRKDKEVAVIVPHKSNVYQMTICKYCIKKLYDLMMYGDR